MSNDLVKRLREVKDWWREPGRTAEQAADRIEALEKALREILSNNPIRGGEGSSSIKDIVDAIMRSSTIARAAREGKDER